MPLTHFFTHFFYRAQFTYIFINKNPFYLCMQQLTEEQRQQLEEKIKSMSPEQLKELQKQQCIFCQIVSGKVSSKKLYEDKKCVVVFDINPAAKGHLLLLPREHYAIMPQVPEEVLGHLFVVAKNLSQVLLKTYKVDGTNVFIANGPAAGQRAQHFMAHLIPRKGGDGILNIEEKLVDAAMVEKVKAAVEGKLRELLESKKFPGSKEEQKIIPVKEEEIFLTSHLAKRYHQKNCAFAQNIPEGSKILFSKEEAAASGKNPCTCVSGRKIPLVKEKPKRKPMQQGVISTVKVEPKQKASKQKREQQGANLDDIARLFS